MIEWENQTNGCWEYLCDNETGSLSQKNLCTSEGDSPMFCINDTKCVDEKEVPNKEWIVEVEVNVTESILFTSEDIILILCDLTDIDNNDLTIVTEYDEDGIIVRFIVYVNDKSTADVIKSVVEECMNRTAPH